MVLHTMSVALQDKVIQKLENNSIAYYIQPVTVEKINVFFGAKECVEVVKHWNLKSLSDSTPEQDFILGMMLGYGRLQQCNRYLDRVNKRELFVHEELHPLKKLA